MNNPFTAWTTKLLITGLAAGALAMPLGAQSSIDLERLTTLAATSTTPAQHADVAVRYRQQADAFAAQAVEHEKKVKQGLRALSGMGHKGRGATSRTVETHKAKAVEARRAAEEATMLAAHYERMSLEATALASQ